MHKRMHLAFKRLFLARGVSRILLGGGGGSITDYTLGFSYGGNDLQWDLNPLLDHCYAVVKIYRSLYRPYR